jgi:hypothetical protein
MSILSQHRDEIRYQMRVLLDKTAAVYSAA